MEEVALCPRQCSAGKPSVLAFMWMLLIHITYLKIVAGHVHHFTAVVVPDGSDIFQQDNVP